MLFVLGINIDIGRRFARGGLSFSLRKHVTDRPEAAILVLLILHVLLFNDGLLLCRVSIKF